LAVRKEGVQKSRIEKGGKKTLKETGDARGGAQGELETGVGLITR